MKAAIFGDIHGNQAALVAVARDMEQLGVEYKVCTGDVVFRGPAPSESLSLLLEMGCDGLVVGNTDQWLVQGFPVGFAPPPERLARLQTYRAWALERLAEQELAMLRSFAFSHRFSLGPHTVQVVHSSPKSTEDWYAASGSDEQLLPIFEGAVPCDILVYGHIHTPYVRRINRRWLINAGSVGNPVDGDARASYLLLEYDRGGLNVQIRRVAYDVAETIRLAEEREFPEAKAYAEALRSGQAF